MTAAERETGERARFHRWSKAAAHADSLLQSYAWFSPLDAHRKCAVVEAVASLLNPEDAWTRTPRTLVQWACRCCSQYPTPAEVEMWRNRLDAIVRTGDLWERLADALDTLDDVDAAGRFLTPAETAREREIDRREERGSPSWAERETGVHSGWDDWYYGDEPCPLSDCTLPLRTHYHFIEIDGSRRVVLNREEVCRG